MAISALTTYHANFPSAFESVAKVRRAVGDFAHGCGFSSADVSDVVLATGEASSNAVEHGHGGAAHIIVGCAFDDDVLRIRITDAGNGFDHAAAGSISLDPGDCVGRGRGIPIMRALMDAVTYECSPTGTTVILEKRLSASRVDEAGGEARRLDAGGRC